MAAIAAGPDAVCCTLTIDDHTSPRTGEKRYPLGRQPDQALTFHRVAPGSYVSTTVLPAGRWTLRLQLASGTDTWRQEVPVQ